MTDPVQVERCDDIAIVSIHRTEKRNALRQEGLDRCGGCCRVTG